MAELRKNRAKQKVEDGGVATIVTQGNGTGDMIEFLGTLGYDGVWIEAEHGPIDFRDIPDLTRACDLWGLTSVVRINLNLPGVIYRTLDVGAQAIVVPHVNTAEEARAVVEGAKFYPLGQRGSYTSRQGVGVAGYQEKANDETMAIILIEDIVAVNNLTEILKVDGISVFFVAPGDLGQSMGNPGADKVAATVERAIGQIASAGKVAGAVVNESNLEKHLDWGARFLLSSWAGWVGAGSKAYLEKVAAATR